MTPDHCRLVVKPTPSDSPEPLPGSRLPPTPEDLPRRDPLDTCTDPSPQALPQSTSLPPPRTVRGYLLPTKRFTLDTCTSLDHSSLPAQPLHTSPDPASSSNLSSVCLSPPISPKRPWGLGRWG